MRGFAGFGYNRQALFAAGRDDGFHTRKRDQLLCRGGNFSIAIDRHSCRQPQFAPIWFQDRCTLITRIIVYFRIDNYGKLFASCRGNHPLDKGRRYHAFGIVGNNHRRNAGYHFQNRGDELIFNVLTDRQG